MTFRVSYNQVRNLIKNGYCLFCFGESEMSKAIRLLTGDCTHVGLLEVVRGRVMVLEAVNSFRHYPLSNYFTNYNNTGKPYPGRIMIGRIKDLSEYEAEIMITEAYGHLGKAYDWNSVTAIAWNETAGKILPKITADDREQLYCSESYNFFYKISTGRQLVENETTFVTPQQIMESSKMQILYEVT